MDAGGLRRQNAGPALGKPLDLTTVHAYALQAEIARLREQRGEKVIGYEVGCTSPAVRQQLGMVLAMKS